MAFRQFARHQQQLREGHFLVLLDTITFRTEFDTRLLGKGPRINLFFTPAVALFFPVVSPGVGGLVIVADFARSEARDSA